MAYGPKNAVYTGHVPELGTKIRIEIAENQAEFSVVARRFDPVHMMHTLTTSDELYRMLQCSMHNDGVWFWVTPDGVQTKIDKFERMRETAPV